MSCESKCAKWFRSGDAACKGCTAVTRNDDSDDDFVCARGLAPDEIEECDCEDCDEDDCPNRKADYLDDDNVDNDGVGDHDSPAHEDEFGNHGDKLYEVEVEVTIHRRATKKVTVAADDEEEAESRGQCAVEDMDEDEMDFSDERDNDVVSCEEKDDYPF